MSFYQHKNPQTKMTILANKIISLVLATVLIAGIGSFSYFSFSNLSEFKVAKAACPAGTYANPGGNTFGADPYGGEQCLPIPDLTLAQLTNTVVACNSATGGSTVASTATNICKFSLPSNTKLPTGFKIGIGGATPAGTCTAATTGLVTCTAVPAGTTVGPNVPVAGQIGTTTGPFANGVPVISGAPDATVISPVTNIGNSATAPCNNTGGSVIIGTPVTCIFPLTGAPNNTYALPTGGLNANIGTATGNASCGIYNNGTTAASLVCVNIPTTGGTPGLRNILVGGQIKGTVTLQTAEAGCTLLKPCFLKTSQYEFTPLKSAVKTYGTDNQDITVKPGLFTTAAASGNKYVCRVSLKVEAKDDADATFGYGAMTARLTSPTGATLVNAGTGANTYRQMDYTDTGCTYRLSAANQIGAKWAYRVIVGEVNASGTMINGNVNQAEPSLFLLYGSVGVVTVIVTPIS